ncbi:MAG: hypothetical protein KTR35_02220 [Gammaproteobacteria bacterium]|nr:hypothetical protein [Gammaproteobacteria bacterium]
MDAVNKPIPDRLPLAVSAIVVSVLALSAGDAIIKLSSAQFPIWQIYVLRSALIIPVLLLLLWKRRPRLRELLGVSTVRRTTGCNQRSKQARRMNTDNRTKSQATA